MIQIDRSRQIAATPELVFAVLAEPANIATVVPRVRRVELLERGAESARIVTYMQLGPFGELRSEGEVRWSSNRELVFRATRPVLVESRWQLAAAGGGTDLRATLSLDLAPIIGPFAALVPASQVENIVGPDLDAALAEIARRAEQHS